MPKTNRVGSTLDTLATLTSQNYADLLRWQYNRLNDHRKQTIYDDLHIGRDGNKATRAQTRIRRLIIALEPRFGRFTGAFLRAAWDQPHIRDHWELERIMCHTATGVLSETTRHRFPQWLTEKNRYANSCGLFTNLLKEILPLNCNEGLWHRHFDYRSRSRNTATNGVRQVLNQNGWAYCCIMLGCHSFTLERHNNTHARIIQVWSDMGRNPPPGFNFAYSIDHHWGFKKQRITAIRDAICRIIRTRNHPARADLKVVIPDTNHNWGINPTNNGDPINGNINNRRTRIRIDTLPTTRVWNVGANIGSVIDRQLQDYRRNLGINIARIQR